MNISIIESIREWFIRKYPEQSFDVGWRYAPVMRLIRRNNYMHILEIGSGASGLTSYLPMTITGVDIFFNDIHNENIRPIKASASSLPMPSNIFDLVISVDTLEHIPGSLRASVISEMLRVTSNRIIIIFPSGEEAALADITYRARYARSHGNDFPYLEEHLDHGLPNDVDVENIIRKAAQELAYKVRIRHQKNANLRVWLWMRLARSSHNPIMRGIDLWSLPLLRFLEPLLNFGRCYRSVYIVEVLEYGNEE